MIKQNNIFTQAEGATGVNKECRLGLLPQHVKFLSLDGRYKANRRSGARTCESVCEGAERVAGAGVRGVPARDNRTTTETISLPYETLPSKQSSELFARGRLGMGY